jgi:hypothetical protein
MIARSIRPCQKMGLGSSQRTARKLEWTKLSGARPSFAGAAACVWIPLGPQVVDVV